MQGLAITWNHTPFLFAAWKCTYKVIFLTFWGKSQWHVTILGSMVTSCLLLSLSSEVEMKPSHLFIRVDLCVSMTILGMSGLQIRDSSTCSTRWRRLRHKTSTVQWTQAHSRQRRPNPSQPWGHPALLVLKSTSVSRCGKHTGTMNTSGVNNNVIWKWKAASASSPEFSEHYCHLLNCKSTATCPKWFLLLSAQSVCKMNANYT